MVLDMNGPHRKIKLNARLSDEEFKALQLYAEKWETENLSDALGKILIRWRYLDDLGFTDQQITEELACICRVQHKGLYYCMATAPRNVNLTRRLLETLQVCAVCKKRQLGLTESSIAPASLLSPKTAEEGIFIPQTESPPAQDPAPIRDPNKNHEGMSYCKNGGLWVYPKRCELCREKTYALFDACQKQTERI